MGADKATIAVDGRRLGDRSVDALRGAGLEVVAVGGEDRLDAPHLPDAHPGEGPLGGVISAFAALDADELVVLPCDLPHLDAAHVASLLAMAGAEPSADVVVATIGGRRAYPIGVWRRSAAAPLAAAFEAGERAFGPAVERCEVAEVEVSDTFRDADRPADLPRAGSLPGDPLTEGGSM
jgi:molybdopterin-guanine dinucleotide biosynthesis protein A